MSTSKDFIEGLLSDLSPLRVRARAMFGEYGFFCDEKIVALVCDDRFFLKPSDAVQQLGLELEPCPPYPGAKEYLIVDDRCMRDRARFRRIVQATADALPLPKPKRAKAPRRKA